MLGIFYHAMHRAYQGVFGEQHMLHYPLYEKSGQSLMEGQRRFTDYCLSFLPPLDGKRLLEVGCGNGVQANYIRSAYQPSYVYGIDISEMHIGLARDEAKRQGFAGIDFAVDDAQALRTAADESFDLAICTESAHHYPDKTKFLSQLKRVLRPGGRFVIADLLRRDGKPPSAIERKMFLYHWGREHYDQALDRLAFNVVAREDFTDRVLKAFDATDGWFTERNGASAPMYLLGRVFGQGLIKLYTYQLTHSLQYFIVAGEKPSAG